MLLSDSLIFSLPGLFLGVSPTVLCPLPWKSVNCKVFSTMVSFSLGLCILQPPAIHTWMPSSQHNHMDLFSTHPPVLLFLCTGDSLSRQPSWKQSHASGKVLSVHLTDIVMCLLPCLKHGFNPGSCISHWFWSINLTSLSPQTCPTSPPVQPPTILTHTFTL